MQRAEGDVQSRECIRIIDVVAGQGGGASLLPAPDAGSCSDVPHPLPACELQSLFSSNALLSFTPPFHFSVRFIAVTSHGLTTIGHDRAIQRRHRCKSLQSESHFLPLPPKPHPVPPITRQYLRNRSTRLGGRRRTLPLSCDYPKQTG